MLHWRHELDKKYAELNSIRRYHDFFVTRNSDGNAELRVREDCSAGDLHITELKLRTGSSCEMQCFPAPHFNYFSSKCEISTEHSSFIARDRWPSYLQSQHPSEISEPEPTQQICENTSGSSRMQRRKKHCSILGCTATGHKNVSRWSEGHTTKAGCPIYRNVTAP